MASHRFISNAEKTLPVVLIEQGIKPTDLYLDFAAGENIDGRVNIAHLARKYGKSRPAMAGWYKLYKLEASQDT